jgi:OFA family oxalate/formate antiporter-like MFS transporter
MKSSRARIVTAAATNNVVTQQGVSFTHNRWLQLGVGIVGMVAIANLQYGWTLFVTPIDRQLSGALRRSRLRSPYLC